MDAALLEFSDRGFDAARMQDIAARAGLSKAGVYLYFDSKEALLRALIENRVAPLATQVDVLAMEGRQDLNAALHSIARTIANKMADPNFNGVPRLVISLAARFPDIAELYRVNVVERVLASLVGLIVAAIDDGRIRRVDPAVAACAFVGPLFL